MCKNIVATTQCNLVIHPCGRRVNRQVQIQLMKEHKNRQVIILIREERIRAKNRKTAHENLSSNIISAQVNLRMKIKHKVSMLKINTFTQD